MQTAGGAIFQAGKVCTGFEFTPRSSGAMVDYTSRVSDPSGRWSNITGRLEPNTDMVDGNFYQKVKRLLKSNVLNWKKVPMERGARRLVEHYLLGQ